MRTHARQQSKPPLGVVRVSIDRGDDRSVRAMIGLTVFVALGSVLGLAIFGSDARRQRVNDNVALSLVALELAALVTVLLVLTVWSKRRDRTERAVALALVACPTALIGLGTAWALLPPEGAACAIRCVVVIVFSVTPAIMWWLFLASQRASLLNEFLANVERLGLLERRRRYHESEASQHTRIASYLQRFEATYGRLSDQVHKQVIAGEYRNYSNADVPTLRPTSTAAVPVFLATVVFAVGWLIALPPVYTPQSQPFRWADALVPTVTPLTFAFLGGYFFAIQMLFRRYVRSDLRGSAYVAIVVRVALAVIGIWAISGIIDTTTMFDATQAQLCLLGFVIGVFPVVVWRVIRSLTTKLFVFVVPNLESKFTLDGLDGLTVWHQSRLEEEDIENIANMATADIVDLLVNTRLPAGRIVDWVDQAILLTYLRESSTESGPVAAELARHGVRTASSLLSVAAVHGGQFGRAVDPCWPDVPSLIAAVRTSPNLALVLRWRGLSDVDVDRPAAGAAPAPIRHVGVGIALLSTLPLAIGRRRSRRRTVGTDPHG